MRRIAVSAWFRLLTSRRATIIHKECKFIAASRDESTTLLSVADHCLRSRQYVNVIVAGKQPQLQYLDMDDAIVHCTKGIGIWDWPSTHPDTEPDVVLGCAGDVPTMETLAAVDLLRSHFPDLSIRVVNVVDLLRLQHESEGPHGLSDIDFDALFTTDKPVIFAYHGYPWLIHRLTYRRTNHGNFHVHGFREVVSRRWDIRQRSSLGGLLPWRHRPGCPA